MIRILAVGSSERINTLMYQLAEEPGVIVDYAHDDSGLARKVVRREAYDLVVLEPDMETECAREVAHALKGAARNYCCVVAPRTDMVGYERGEDGVDFVVGNLAKRCMEAYQVFCEGRSDIDREEGTMRVLVVGKGAGVLEAMRLAEMGCTVGCAPNEMLARMDFLGRCSYDLVLLLGCERLEEGDLSAERIKEAAVTVDSMNEPPVFVLWRATVGYVHGAAYGLKAIDILIEDLSVERVMHAYEHIKNNSATR